MPSEHAGEKEEVRKEDPRLPDRSKKVSAGQTGSPRARISCHRSLESNRYGRHVSACLTHLPTEVGSQTVDAVGDTPVFHSNTTLESLPCSVLAGVKSGRTWPQQERSLRSQSAASGSHLPGTILAAMYLSSTLPWLTHFPTEVGSQVSGHKTNEQPPVGQKFGELNLLPVVYVEEFKPSLRPSLGH